MWFSNEYQLNKPSNLSRITVRKQSIHCRTDFLKCTWETNPSICLKLGADIHGKMTNIQYYDTSSFPRQL